MRATSGKQAQQMMLIGPATYQGACPRLCWTRQIASHLWVLDVASARLIVSQRRHVSFALGAHFAGLGETSHGSHGRRLLARMQALCSGLGNFALSCPLICQRPASVTTWEGCVKSVLNLVQNLLPILAPELAQEASYLHKCLSPPAAVLPFFCSVITVGDALLNETNALLNRPNLSSHCAMARIQRKLCQSVTKPSLPRLETKTNARIERVVRLLGYLAGVLGSRAGLWVDKGAYKVQSLKREPPGLAYAPLFHLLPSLPNGDAVLAATRTACLSAMCLSLSQLVRSSTTRVEKAIVSWTEEHQSSARPPCCSKKTPLLHSEAVSRIL
jgi:hypothetical protein